MPLFLNDAAFRNYILPKVKYNTDLVDYWRYEYEEKQAQSARNRVGSLLANPYVRHIIGQQRTTIDFEQIVKNTTRRQLPQFVFLRLPATLADDARHFIGTIIVTELLHAIQTRDPQEAEDNFCVYVDEFQNLATNQLAKFILEAGKWGCAVSLAHQERRGQFTENDEILGATMASANKVIFQCTVNDARELAPEFAEKLVVLQTRFVPEMVIHKEPMWYLKERGHKNPRVMELYRGYLEPYFTLLNTRKDEAEIFALDRSGHFDQAMLYRDQVGLSGVNRENRMNAMARGRDTVISNIALDRSEALLYQAMQQHGLAEAILQEMQITLRSIHTVRGYVKWLEDFFITIMETGHVLEVSTKVLAQFLISTTNSRMVHICDYINELYLWVKYGDPQQPRIFKPDSLGYHVPFTRKYFYQLAEKAYIAQELAEQYREHIENPDFVIANYPDTKQYQIENARKKFEKGFYIFLGKSMKILYPRLYLGVLSAHERAYVEKACYETICEQPRSEGFFQAIEDMQEFCQLLVQPENHILVASGQYVEKPVQIASTQEMINQAVATLPELPRFTAYAKTINREGSEEVTWKGRIKWCIL